MSREEAAAKRMQNRLARKKTITLEEWCENNSERGKQLLREWADKNKTKPSDYTYGSRTKVWWKCDKGHYFMASIGNRVGNGSSCIYCANKAAWPGYNDLATLNPELAKEWNYTKNVKLPSEVRPGSQKKYWWICEKRHEWEASPHNRTIGNTGCPYCTGRLPIKGETDLETLFPNVASEWNYKRNGNLKPSDVTYGSSKKVWWICEKNHEWEASIAHRINGRGCPKCKGEKSTSFPEQALLYYVKKAFPDAINRYKPSWLKVKSSVSEIDIFVPSAMIGFEYDGQNYHKNIHRDEMKDNIVYANNIILYRIREPLCPKLSTNSKCIYIDSVNTQFYYEQAFKELFYELSKKYTFSPIDIDIKRDYAEILELYKFIEKENSFIKRNPELLKEWNYEKNNINPTTLSYGSRHFIWWKCTSCGNEWQDTIKHRVRGRGCPICGVKNRSKKRIQNQIRDNKTLSLRKWCEENPKRGQILLAEWAECNEKKPEDFSYGSRVKVGWVCDKGHYFESAIGNRVINETSCPYCANKATLEGFNDLATTHPSLIKEWDFNKNTIQPTEVRAGNPKKVWWVCSNNHSYEASIGNRTAGTGCPYCANQKVLPGYNDMASKYPELLEEWDYEKNQFLPTTVTCGTQKKAYWKCKYCGNEWYSSICNRTGGAGCPRCAKSKAGKIARQNDKLKRNTDMIE